MFSHAQDLNILLKLLRVGLASSIEGAAGHDRKVAERGPNPGDRYESYAKKDRCFPMWEVLRHRWILCHRGHELKMFQPKIRHTFGGTGAKTPAIAYERTKEPAALGITVVYPCKTPLRTLGNVPMADQGAYVRALPYHL
jgi:hypothetical protein